MNGDPSKFLTFTPKDDGNMILSGNYKYKIVDIASNLDDEIKDVKISKIEAVTRNEDHYVPDRDEPAHQTAPVISSRSSHQHLTRKKRFYATYPHDLSLEIQHK